MTMVSSGAISLGGSTPTVCVEAELGMNGTAPLTMNDAAARTLAGVASGPYMMTAFYGKSNAITPVLRIYTSGTNATETAPAGAKNVVIEVWGGGESGAHSSKVNGGGGGGGGGYSKSSYSITGGNTLNYSVGTGGTGGNGVSGTSSTVASGTKTITTMTANSGSGAAVGIPGSGGSASGVDILPALKDGDSYGAAR